MARIMIIEKDEDVSIQVMKWLKRKKYTVVEIIDTDNILSRIYSFKPDIFVLGSNCEQIEIRLKAFAPTGNIPVIRLPEISYDADKLIAAIEQSTRYDSFTA